MILVGQTSGAQATVTNLRLISDISGTVQGSFFIPNPNNSLNPRFETGDKVFTLINNVDNDQNAATSIAQEGFISSGTLETTQETIISVRNARVDRVSAIQERDVSRITGTELIDSQVIASSFQRDRPQNPDPLSQSFLVDEDSGVFITKCDVFFETRDENDIPVTMQIRTMENGLPTTRVLPFSEVNLTPAEVNVSADGSVATTFDFRAPVYLEGGQEYCVTLLSNLSTQYSVFISRVGEVDFITQTFISNQPYLGSLFKSQNGSTWEPSQWEDLKFTLYRADFVETGSVEFYNPRIN